MTIPMSMSMQIRGRCGDGGRTVTWIRWRSFGSLEIGFRSLLLGADHDVYNNTNFPNNVKFLDLFTLQMDRMSLLHVKISFILPLIPSTLFLWSHFIFVFRLKTCLPLFCNCNPYTSIVPYKIISSEKVCLWTATFIE